jgi:hypothetical protein
LFSNVHGGYPVESRKPTDLLRFIEGRHARGELIECIDQINSDHREGQLTDGHYQNLRCRIAAKQKRTARKNGKPTPSPATAMV